MAGSYDHITTSEGDWKGIKLIETMGDAEEALFECWAIIQCLASGNQLLIADAKDQAMRIVRGSRGR
jgi:hypothetical protein